MTQRFSAQTWLTWTVAAGFVVVVTRNPLYLSLMMISILAVYLSLAHRSTIALAWGTVLRIGVVIAVISVLFNMLTVHSGDRQFGSLPPAWPIIGGPLTWNAVLYGVISGVALMCLLLIAATLSTAVDRAALIRLVPQSLGTIGIAAAAALSIFPQTILAIGQVREAHRARGIQIRSLRDVQRMIVPVLNIGLERGFHLAESMESRAFGNRAVSPPVPASATLGLLSALTLGAVLAGIGYPRAGGVALIGSAAILLVLVRRARPIPIARYRESRIRRTDLPLLASSMLMIGLTAIALVTDPARLNYSTYPQLVTPDFSVTIAFVCALAILPAVLPGRKIEPGLSHA